MKAWQVYSYFTDNSTIVFAETAGKAKSIAWRYNLFYDDYTDFMDIYCQRRKEGDKFYNGKSFLDWECREDRLLLVKEFGFTCIEELYDERECAYCVAKKFCSLHKEMQERKKTYEKKVSKK